LCAARRTRTDNNSRERRDSTECTCDSEILVAISNDLHPKADGKALRIQPRTGTSADTDAEGFPRGLRYLPDKAGDGANELMKKRLTWGNCCSI
jgi:hypothetical protein